MLRPQFYVSGYEMANLIARSPRHIQIVFNLTLETHNNFSWQLSKKRVSDDQSHMSVSRSQVYNSLRWGFLLKLLAHQFLVFNWSRTVIHFFIFEYSLLSAYGKSWITWESTLSKDPSRALLSPLAKSEYYCFMLSRFGIGGHRGVGSAGGCWLQVKNGWNFSPDLKMESIFLVDFMAVEENWLMIRVARRLGFL